jgi:hypothetical protein
MRMAGGELALERRVLGRQSWLGAQAVAEEPVALPPRRAAP